MSRNELTYLFIKKSYYYEKSTLPTTRESDIEAAEAEAAATSTTIATAATPAAATAAAGAMAAASKRFCNQRSSSPAFFPFSDVNGQCTIFYKNFESVNI